MNCKIFLICLLFFSSCVFAIEPKNLDVIKQQLIRYHDSGEYSKDQAKVIHQALEYLKARLQHPDKKPLAIVLDIDETALSNYSDMLKMGFGGKQNDIEQAEDQSTDPVIEPTLKLYQFAKENNIAVFFVTGRREKYRSSTIRNLEAAGFKNWNGLFLKPNEYNEKSVANYKIDARKQIENQGYDIVLSIGDQQSDLRGGHADKKFKMPNPYYLIP